MSKTKQKKKQSYCTVHNKQNKCKWYNNDNSACSTCAYKIEL